MPLSNVEQLYRQLVARPEDVVTTAAEAAQVWKLFRKHPIDPAAVERFEYRAFLQAAMMGAIDGSYAMSWIEVLMRSALVPSASLKSFATKLMTNTLRRYYTHAWKGDGEPKLYDTVLASINYGCGHYFRCIEAGIDL